MYALLSACWSALALRPTAYARKRVASGEARDRREMIAERDEMRRRRWQLVGSSRRSEGVLSNRV